MSAARFLDVCHPFVMSRGAKRFAVMLGGALAVCGLLSETRAAITLPDPTDTVDGIPVAIQYDEFFSYSAKLLDLWQGAPTPVGERLPASLGDFQFSSGTGGLDVLLYTGANGQSNQNVGPDGPDMGNHGDFDFEDPLDAPGGSATTFNGWWGQNDIDNDATADNVQGPVLVDTVLSYVQAFDPANSIPVFYFDMNQTGNQLNLLISAEVYIWDPVNMVKVASWSLDTVNNGVYDPSSPASAQGEVSVVGTSTTLYEVSHNAGSGKPDFIAYAPTMTLDDYDGMGYLFVGNFRLGDINDGPEELFLTGGIAPPRENVIPEPASLVAWSVLSFGGFGCWFARRGARPKA